VIIMSVTTEVKSDGTVIIRTGNKKYKKSKRKRNVGFDFRGIGAKMR
tara:strand:- start:2440 stop:2580 length:141 start_codon:yes stop_codon:yes gene_type:complete